jgi:hypothetical protein
MEAAAEQRLSAALARERAKSDKQARGLLCTCGRWLHRPSLVLQRACAASWNSHKCHACCSTGHVVPELGLIM